MTKRRLLNLLLGFWIGFFFPVHFYPTGAYLSAFGHCAGVEIQPTPGFFVDGDCQS